MSKNYRSDDFNTTSFEPIRPGNPNYEQYFNKPIEIGDLSEFEDEPSVPPARNGFDQLAEENLDEPYENYDIDEDYYEDEPATYNYDNLARGAVIAIAVIMGSIIIAVIAMFAIVKSDSNNTTNSHPDITSATTTVATSTEATTSLVSTTQTATSTTVETTTTEAETTPTTETTTTEATTEATTTTQAVTTTETTTTQAVTTTETPTTQPPTTTQATTEPTTAPPTTEAQPESTTEVNSGPGEDVVDLDPEIPGIQAPW